MDKQVRAMGTPLHSPFDPTAASAGGGEANEIECLLRSQRKFYQASRTKKPNFRLRQLTRLKQAIHTHEPQILSALQEDLRKAPFEAYATEVGMVLEEINYFIRHLPGLSKRTPVKTSLSQFPAKGYIYKEPYGTALIMAPWNYPFQLSLAPLAAAIAAGNCVMLKPSEYAPAVSEVLSQILGEIFPPSYVCVIEGGRAVNQELLRHKFDYIFFTGSSTVGKIVMKAAAEHLTPVTLELGGKSPCIVDETADLKTAAKRIVWGKFLNAGQTCVAPDYLLVHEDVKKELLEEMKRAIRKFYGKRPVDNPDYPKIINQKHMLRLIHLMRSGTVTYGGNYDITSLIIEPTLLEHVSVHSPIMREEIFGPLLPVFTFHDLHKVSEKINQGSRPLALYLFTSNKEHEQWILKNTAFGGGCINDTVIHLAGPYLPFGGIGESGMGSYHGKAGFDTFTHEKSILKKEYRPDIPLRYPPYRSHLKLLRKLLP